ncbi:MAG: glycosyltransferase family 2 protein [Henriciella sp.]|nr:glycosyltransferase family 2 protein [Henriciella sp.]
MTDTVSIIIPCYNKRPYVTTAIESALSQTHPCEVIVIDDGSTDGSLDEVKQFDGQILWETGPNRGGSAARNRGLDRATGSYVQFLDADDILPPEKIAVQMSALQSAPSNAIAFCPWSYFHDDGHQDAPDARRYWRGYDEGLALLMDMWRHGGFFPPHAWLTPRALIDEVGPWDETLTGDDDGEFFGRVLAAAGEVRFCDQTRVLYRDPPEGSVSRNTSLKSARSFWSAFELIANRILEKRDDQTAKRACLSRLRKTAYAWRAVDEIVDKAAAFERKLGVFDFSPGLPRGTRYLIGLFGIRRGLHLRQLIKA